MGLPEAQLVALLSGQTLTVRAFLRFERREKLAYSTLPAGAQGRSDQCCQAEAQAAGVAWSPTLPSGWAEQLNPRSPAQGRSSCGAATRSSLPLIWYCA